MTPTQRYTPQAGSLAGQLCGFFANNPDEELTVDDISDKFMASRGNVHTLLIQAREAGALAREKNDDGEYVYKAGRMIVEAYSTRHATTTLAAERAAHTAPLAPGRKLAGSVLVPDVATLMIEDGVPLPGTGRPRVNWAPVMRALQAGQSTLLPIRARSSLQREITKAHKSKTGAWKLQAQPDTASLRLWRTA